MTVLTCRGCGRKFTTRLRDRYSARWCSDDCRPKCDYPGCVNIAAPLGDRCWHHRNATPPADG